MSEVLINEDGTATVSETVEKVYSLEEIENELSILRKNIETHQARIAELEDIKSKINPS